MSVRQVQRLKRRLQRDGVRGLVHGLRGQPSNLRLPRELYDQIRAFMNDTYRGFNDSHLTEKLHEVRCVRNQYPVNNQSPIQISAANTGR